MFLVERFECGSCLGSLETNFAHSLTLRIKAQRMQCPCPRSHSKLVADGEPVLRSPTS